MFITFLSIFFLLFVLIYLGTFIIVGIYLLFNSYKKKLINLIYPGLAFLILASAEIMTITVNLDYIIDSILTGLFLILIILFTNYTFHKEQKSIVFHHKHLSYLPNIVLIVSVFNVFITIILNFFRQINFSPEIHYLRLFYNFLTYFIVFIWLGGSSYSAYLNLKNEYMEPWLKVRYKLMTYITIITPFIQLIPLFQPLNVRFGSIEPLESFIVFGTAAICSVIISIGSIITWLMPNKLKEYINKDFVKLIDKNFSQEELTEIIKYIAEKLSEKINLTATAVRGLIKLAIQEEFGIYIKLSILSFNNFKKVIQGSLKQRLLNLKIDDSEEIVEYLLNSLIKSQSLITFERL